jgi:hypothetical protein
MPPVILGDSELSEGGSSGLGMMGLVALWGFVNCRLLSELSVSLMESWASLLLKRIGF